MTTIEVLHTCKALEFYFEAMGIDSDDPDYRQLKTKE